MSYEYHRTQWVDGMVITADRLNNIEEGVTVALGGLPTCFRGDTTYVTMFDGSKKKIQDVKSGDSVLGYDVNEQKYCESIVLENVVTGHEQGFDCYVMSDGTTIDIFGGDDFIIVQDIGEKYRDKGLDYITYATTTNLLKWAENNDNHCHRRIIKDTGNDNGQHDNTVSVVCKRWFDCSDLTPRYAIFTSNGTCFVNGLLHCGSFVSLIGCIRRLRVKSSNVSKVENVFNEVMLEATKIDERLPDDHIESVSNIGDILELETVKSIITENKNFLSSTDYKAMKFAEGELSEEEWTPIKERRSQARKTINEKEAIIHQIIARVKLNNPAFVTKESNPDWWFVQNKIWKKQQSILNDHLEDFRACTRRENGM